MHTGYYYQRGNLARPVELLEVQGQIHWYDLTYDSLWSQYEVDIDNQIEPENEYLGYFPITDPRHVDYIPEPETFHEAEPEPEEEFLAGGVHHVATLQGPQAQLSPTHPVKVG